MVESSAAAILTGARRTRVRTQSLSSGQKNGNFLKQLPGLQICQLKVEILNILFQFLKEKRINVDGGTSYWLECSLMNYEYVPEQKLLNLQ